MERAYEHFDSLNTQVGEYLDRGPYEVVRKDHPDFGLGGRHMVAFILRLAEKAPPILGGILGDYVHNLRSVLDHLAWELVLAAGNDPRPGPRGTRFPIYAEKPPEGVDIVPGVDPNALALVESFQPYHMGDDAKLHPLAVIHTLSNIDKHRHLVLASAYTLNAKANIRDKRTGVVYSNPLATGFLYDDAVIGWYAATPEGPLLGDKAEVETEGATTVSLRDLEGWEHVPVQILLENTLDFIEEQVIPGLTRFLHPSS
jgi:hypothetical protein